MAYGFNDDKSKVEVYTKDDFLIIDIEESMSARQAYTEFTKTLSGIDNVDNYALISAMVYETGSTTTGLAAKWINRYVLTSETNFSEMPTVYLYNDNGTPKIKYGLISFINVASTVKLRVVLMKIR